MTESDNQELMKIAHDSLTRAGASGKLYANTSPSSFGERAQSHSDRSGSCFFQHPSDDGCPQMGGGQM
jgi:hypothetical protein